MSHADAPSRSKTSTPYLFVKSSGKFYLENDVMNTYHNTYQEIAKRQYEKNGGDPRAVRQEELYKIRLKPDVSAKGITFQLKELEPEESHIDQVRLVRVIHPKGAYVFADQESNTIKAIQRSSPSAPQSCSIKGADCLKAIKSLDKAHIDADRGDRMTVTFDLKGRNVKNLYLTLNAWKKSIDKPQLSPYKASTGNNSIVPVIILDPAHPEKPKQLKHLHPRAMASRLEVGLGDALRGYKGDTLSIELQWTNHHFVDYVALIEAQPVVFKREELSLTKAAHSKTKNVLWRLLRKDKIYVHTVRGQSVDLTFARPRKTLKEGETETYFFVSSGYYHGLRTFMYPKVDPSEESFRKELQSHINDLNAFLNAKNP